ncbi:MAG: homocysteine S-methyltransferase [Pseudomonadales bacterium]|nr:homocysteine S-methyltransferase [Pseudomonadales bacterium]
MTELTILDGGMGVELIARGVTSKDGLWSAQALVDDPETVAEVHRDYVKAGARVIITNSYSTIPSYLEKAGLANEYLRYTKVAGEIARRVADEFDGQVKVAGSLPPLDESYRYDLAPADEDALPIYRSLTETLNPYVDLYVCETMACVREACNASQAALESGKPFWVAWTLAEEPGSGLRSGESIAAAFAALTPFNPEAYLFNCSTPESITPALGQLRALTDKPIGVYPNLLHIPKDWTLDNEVSAGYRELAVEDFVGFAHEWRHQGATIIGGCCGIGPDYIQALAAGV